MQEIQIWLTTLDRQFLFLLILPFGVALAGIARGICDKRKETEKQ